MSASSLGSNALGRLVLAGCICLLAGSILGLRSQGGAAPPGSMAPGAGSPSDLPVLPIVPRPPAEQPPVGLAVDRHLDKTPPRKTKGLDLVKLGWTYNCMECHKLLKARWHYDRPMAEHQDTHLEHGNNRFCLNCHHPTNRNAFVDYDSSEIAQADVVLLCAKCHGPTFNDWQAGVHGRSNGHWDVRLGTKTKLRCIQCHDPHQPKFKSMKPQPPLRYPIRGANPPGIRAAPSESVAPVGVKH